jgi:hypothetical protein
MATDMGQEAQHGAACAEGCCDPETQPGMFNRYTLMGLGALAIIFGGAVLFQALFS